MADNDNSVRILIEFIEKTQGADAAQAAMVKLKEETAKGTEVIGENVEANKKVSEAVEHTGHSAGNARLEHMALHHAFTELNKVSPGLGTSMMFLARGMHMGEEAAKGFAEGTNEAKVAMEGAMATVLPLIAVMLTIQTITTYWDLYSESVKAAAEEQEKAMKKIQDSSHEAFNAVKELEELLHPKEKTVAEKDESDLDIYKAVDDN